MDVRWLTAFLDFPEDAFDSGCRFWCAVTGTRRSAPRGRSNEFATLVPEGGDAFLRVQRLDEGTARCHLDLHVDDVPAMADRALRRGASVVEGRAGTVLLRSPQGVRFCIARANGEAHRPPPQRWHAGQRSLVDQFSIDVASDGFAEEARFWEAMTGWPRRASSRSEFEYLVRPAGMPLRLLLQRLEEPSGAACRAHLDLACDDVPAESLRHEALGAVPVRTTANWTTLRDPVGLLYCITRRDPDTGTL